MRFNFLFFGTFLFVLSACATKKTILPISAYDTSFEVDYNDLNNWASHPDKIDAGDAVPRTKNPADYTNTEVDVFFVHPTTFTDKEEKRYWNASLDDQQLNENTDEQPIKYQATIFNQVGRLFAPRYRQAHLRSYYAKDTVASKKAFQRAYDDVEAAFLHYLQTENDGRPFIIASHSQGTTHSVPLVKKHIDGSAIQEKLVAAYLVGMPVGFNQFENIEPCGSPDQTNCFTSWRTYRYGHTPTTIVGDHIVSTNPLSWKLDGVHVDKSQHKGAILRNFNKVFTERVDAQSQNGILWAHRPKFPFSFFLKTNNYHIADFNFYYVDVQENAKLRVKSYLAEM